MFPIAFLALILAQAPEQAPPPRLEEAPTFAFALDDGTLLRASPITPALTLRTAHGDLSVKWSDLRSLKLGPRLSATESARYSAALKLLGSDTHADREQAMSDMVAIGPRVYHRLKGIGKADMETHRRAEQLLKALEDKHSPGRLRAAVPDAFRTPTVSGTGTVAEKSLRIKTAYLGEAEIDLAYVRSITPVGLVDGLTITVKAAAPMVWVDTGLDLDGSVRMTATGTVDLWPQAPGYACDPWGYNAQGRNSSNRAGALVYRLGDGAETFAGKSCTVRGSGRLYLGIVAAPWNGGMPSGEYMVRVYPE